MRITITNTLLPTITLFLQKKKKTRCIRVNVHEWWPSSPSLFHIHATISLFRTSFFLFFFLGISSFFNKLFYSQKKFSYPRCIFLFFAYEYSHCDRKKTGAKSQSNFKCTYIVTSYSQTSSRCHFFFSSRTRELEQWREGLKWKQLLTGNAFPPGLDGKVERRRGRRRLRAWGEGKGERDFTEAAAVSSNLLF